MPSRFFNGKVNLTDVKTQMEPAWRNVTAQRSGIMTSVGRKPPFVFLTAALRPCHMGSWVGSGKEDQAARMPWVLP